MNNNIFDVHLIKNNKEIIYRVGSPSQNSAAQTVCDIEQTTLKNIKKVIRVNQ